MRCQGVIKSILVYFAHLGVCFDHPDLLLANGARTHHILILVIRLLYCQGMN